MGLEALQQLGAPAVPSTTSGGSQLPVTPALGEPWPLTSEGTYVHKHNPIYEQVFFKMYLYKEKIG